MIGLDPMRQQLTFRDLPTGGWSITILEYDII